MNYVDAVKQVRQKERLSGMAFTAIAHPIRSYLIMQLKKGVPEALELSENHPIFAEVFPVEVARYNYKDRSDLNNRASHISNPALLHAEEGCDGKLMIRIGSERVGHIELPEEEKRIIREKAPTIIHDFLHSVIVLDRSRLKMASAAWHETAISRLTNSVMGESHTLINALNKKLEANSLKIEAGDLVGVGRS